MCNPLASFKLLPKQHSESDQLSLPGLLIWLCSAGLPLPVSLPICLSFFFMRRWVRLCNLDLSSVFMALVSLCMYVSSSMHLSVWLSIGIEKLILWLLILSIICLSYGSKELIYIRVRPLSSANKKRARGKRWPTDSILRPFLASLSSSLRLAENHATDENRIDKICSEILLTLYPAVGSP